LAEIRPKDPAKVYAGRLGALKLHATHDPSEVTRPARAAFLARFEREVDPDSRLEPAERSRRAEYARRAYMLRLITKRWANRPGLTP
jgi:hypothetical protein